MAYECVLSVDPRVLFLNGGYILHDAVDALVNVRQISFCHRSFSFPLESYP